MLLVVQIGVLWEMMYMVFQEYDPTHIETIGLAMVILPVVIGSAMFLWMFYQLLKWKPS